MAWLRIDDGIYSHPKVAAAGPAAAWLWMTSLCYCRRYLTDGRFPKAAITLSGLKKVKALKEAAALVSVGLWHEDGDSYVVHDFLAWNPSRADVESSKEWDRRRKELYADKSLVDDIRARDGDECRYCGVTVSWSDRRGPGGGQFDHVRPRGPNSVENIVVSCRRCNASKNGRTPDDAGMPLRPPKNQVGLSSGTSSFSCVGAGDATSPSSVSVLSGSADGTNTTGGIARPIHGRRNPDLLTHGPIKLWASQFRDELVPLVATHFGGDRDAAYGPALRWVGELDTANLTTTPSREALAKPHVWWNTHARERWGVAQSVADDPWLKVGEK